MQGTQGPAAQILTAGPSVPLIVPAANSFPAIVGARWTERGNRLTIPVQCPMGAGICEVHLTVKKGRTTIGTASALLREGTTRNVRLRLRKTRAKSSRARRTKLSATVDSRDARGLFTRTQRSVSMKI